MTRLPALACCLLLLTAGCSAFAGGDPFRPTTVDEVEVSNVDSDPHTVTVAISRNRTVVYLDSFRLNGTTRGPDGIDPDGAVLEPSALTRPGNYSVAVRVDDGRPARVWLSAPDACRNGTNLLLRAERNGEPGVFVGCADG